MAKKFVTVTENVSYKFDDRVNGCLKDGYEIVSANYTNEGFYVAFMIKEDK